jgi:undecaprenyl-diphosphatase
MLHSVEFDDAVWLGLLHGLTEFLPLSSDAHVALAETLLDIGVGSAGYDAERITLHACLRAGALLAGITYFRERIATTAIAAWHSLRAGRLPGPNSPGGDAVFVAVASLPTALLGALLHPLVERWQGRPLIIGCGLMLGALCLTSSLWARAGSRTSVTPLGAALIGLGQGLAWFPGLSRCAVNLTLALWLGVRAERAFELALLATLPALAGALGFQLFYVDQLTGSALALSCGAVVAFGGGLLGLVLLRRLMQHGYVAWCALWLLPVALASLALAKAWPR